MCKEKLYLILDFGHLLKINSLNPLLTLTLFRRERGQTLLKTDT
jgi:hypothetical protein